MVADPGQNDSESAGYLENTCDSREGWGERQIRDLHNT